ncbi:MAG: DUF120 domain-containing protein [Candidatus Bathyarchaeia archaeon]
MTEECETPTKTVCVKGKIVSGVGEGSFFTMLSWVRRQIREKLGFAPYPGTLNLKLTGEYLDVRKLLEDAKAIEILPEPGYCRGKCFRAYIGHDVVCAVVLPCVENYPRDVLEIIAPSNLREKLKLKNGDELEVRIAFE